ncbi:hypothetical protein LCGC14_1417040 [marine sediment metagenome]|uniref:Uncharacterized protein n=1 Tax=marine sediment metagenome TaxID=412755 RepID=A0A0F9JSJ5_9ZZZZ
MRRDFDYVGMADYQHDMDELARNGTAIIDQMQHENRDLKRVIAALIHAAGPISIPRGLFERDDLHIETSENTDRCELRFAPVR